MLTIMVLELTFCGILFTLYELLVSVWQHSIVKYAINGERSRLLAAIKYRSENNLFGGGDKMYRLRVRRNPKRPLTLVTVTDGPVSYTHLDVYKRQGFAYHI